MAWTLKANTSASGTTDSVTTSSIDTTGANLLVIGVSYNTGVPPTFSDSKSNTWTALVPGEAPANGAAIIYYCVNPTVGTGHTFSNTSVSGFSVICAQAWDSGNPNPSLDLSNQHQRSESTIQTGSLTPRQDGELVVTHFMFSVAGVASIGGGFTISNQTNFTGGNNYGGAMAYLAQTTAAAANPTWTSGGGFTGLATTMATFRPGMTLKTGWLRA